MKIKRSFIIFISMMLICFPKPIYAWLESSTYDACNILNLCISWLLRLISYIIAITYITKTIKYTRHSEDERKEKIKNTLTWLIIAIVEITFFLSASVWVTEIGMETYWSSGERVRHIDEYISNSFRITSLISIIVYIVISIKYLMKSKQEEIRKVENVIRGQIITSAIAGGLLIFATRW